MALLLARRVCRNASGGVYNDRFAEPIARVPSTFVYCADNLAHLINEVGSDRIVLGTDYPFPIAAEDPVGDALAVEGLGDDELVAILGGTAAELLGL